ncbi:MAG: Crp/Fnr family transcriptional regulator [Niastella sp.]|nr:Crp/Fnr family transcriptional regulator [Niastella sp.]
METGTDIFLRSVNAVCPGLTQVELSLFSDKLTTKELKKRDLFLQAGKVQKSIGFIATGLVRSFFIDQEGIETTVGFYPEGDYATHYPAFILQKPSRYSIQCLEPTTMVYLSFDDMQQLYREVPTIQQYGRLVAEEILKRQQARIESFIFQTAEERYLDFVEQHPTLFNRVSLSHLCSYLGIERQTLTRIRQKLAHQ